MTTPGCRGLRVIMCQEQLTCGIEAAHVLAISCDWQRPNTQPENNNGQKHFLTQLCKAAGLGFELSVHIVQCKL
jgi:hypothetical protein